MRKFIEGGKTMIEQTQIDHLEHLFRLSDKIKASSFFSHMVGKCYALESAEHQSDNFILQLYESIHTKRQISSDLSTLRLLANLGYDVPLPLISRNGDSIDTLTFPKPSVLFSSPTKISKEISTPSEIFLAASQIAKISHAICDHKDGGAYGKKIDAIFTMFELIMREENLVDDYFKSEYFAFKSLFIELLNKETLSSFAFFPGNDKFFLTKKNSLGFTYRSFLYDMPELFALAQFILRTCFNKDHTLNFDKLDQAISGYEKESSLTEKDWSELDSTLKCAAFLDVLCSWLTMIYHPKLMHTDLLIEARMKQKHLIKFVLKEAF